MSNSQVKVAIIDATAAGKGKRRFTPDAIGCGVRSVSGILEQHGITVRIFLAEDILEKGFKEKFSALLISGMSMDKVAIRKVANLWRKNHSGRVIVGGPVTSELAESLLATTADLIVIGEGEFTLTELVKEGHLTGTTINGLEKINGIGYMDENNNPVINQFRKYSSRDEFRLFKPVTKRIKEYPNFFSAKVYVECVRGCSNFGGTRLRLPDGRECSECGHCDSNRLEDRASCPDSIPPGCGFCSVPSLYGPPRSRAAEDIVTEIADLIKYGVKRIILSAPDFLDYEREALIAPKPLINTSRPKANLEKLEELLSKIHSIEQVAAGKVWVEIENVKASLFTVDTAKIIAKYLPNSPFSIGCETGSAEHARLLGRPSDPKDTFRAVRIAHRYGLRAHVYFIHSLPGQTKQSAIETATLIRKIAPYIEKVTIYRFRPLPLSAFGDFPEPQAAIRNPVSKIISEAANAVNLSKKKNYIGKIERVIISEPNFKDETGAIAYILGGGPMIAVTNSRERIGEIVKVKIIKALSDKLLLGEIIEEEY